MWRVVSSTVLMWRLVWRLYHVCVNTQDVCRYLNMSQWSFASFISVRLVLCALMLSHKTVYYYTLPQFLDNRTYSHMFGRHRQQQVAHMEKK